MRLFISYMLSLLFCATVCNAQEVTVQSKIDSIAILIGQQAHLSVEVSAKEGANVVFPHFKRSQYYVPGVEVLEETSSEPVVSDGILKVSHSYTLTSFDEKLYPLPGIKVKVNREILPSKGCSRQSFHVERVDTIDMVGTCCNSVVSGFCLFVAAIEAQQANYSQDSHCEGCSSASEGAQRD